MGDNNLCRRSFYCSFAVIVVTLAFLVQLLVVGLFFVFPYLSDCGQSNFLSPLRSSDLSCETNSTQFRSFIYPPGCTNASLSVPYCFDHCSKPDICIPGARCCCRSVPQTETYNCTGYELEVSINASCVYAVCDSTAHSVILQVYDSSQLNSTHRTGIPNLYLQFGPHIPVATSANGTVTYNPVYEGRYPIRVLSSDLTSYSTEYFHASTLSISFYSPSQVVYIVYVKNLTAATNTPDILSCSISSNHTTTQFVQTLSDLVTLPNTFMHNNTFFTPASVAYTTGPINITCPTDYTLFYYTPGGIWETDNVRKNTFSISPPALWSLSQDTLQTAYTVYIHPGTSPLILDRGANLILTDSNWFVSRVTSHNMTTLSVPVITAPNINIRYTTSSYSLILSSSPIVYLESFSSDNFTNNCSLSLNTHDIIGNTDSAMLSVTNSPNYDTTCYHPVNATQNNSINNVTFALSLSSAGTTVYFSTLQTNSCYACLPYPCAMSGYLCEVSATEPGYAILFQRNCVLANNSLELLECNMQLQNLKSQS